MKIIFLRSRENVARLECSNLANVPISPRLYFVTNKMPDLHWFLFLKHPKELTFLFSNKINDLWLRLGLWCPNFHYSLMHFSIFLLLMPHSIPVTFPSLIHSFSMSWYISAFAPPLSFFFQSSFLSHSIMFMLSTSITCLTLITPNMDFQGKSTPLSSPCTKRSFSKVIHTQNVPYQILIFPIDLLLFVVFCTCLSHWN